MLDKVQEAVGSAKDRNFVESIELAINLKDIDMNLPKNRIDEEVRLPNGRGKAVKVCIFGSDELAVKARDVADLVVLPEQIEDLADEKKRVKVMADSHEFFLAETPLMPTIGKRLGIVLGPRGKMPKPIPPGADPKPLVDSLRTTVRIRTKDKLTFHVPVGTKSMPPEQIVENIDVIMKRIEGRLERGRMNIRSVYLKTTMGPSVRII